MCCHVNKPYRTRLNDAIKLTRGALIFELVWYMFIWTDNECKILKTFSLDLHKMYIQIQSNILSLVSEILSIVYS